MRRIFLYGIPCLCLGVLYLARTLPAQIPTAVLSISDVLGLEEELIMRPVRGSGYVPSRAAVINSAGQVESAAGSLGDCVHVDGTSGPCGGGTAADDKAAIPPTSIVVDCESPPGAQSVFTLMHTPAPTESLRVFVNGLRMKRGLDYIISESQIQFMPNSSPTGTDAICIDYTYTSE